MQRCAQQTQRSMQDCVNATTGLMHDPQQELVVNTDADTLGQLCSLNVVKPVQLRATWLMLWPVN